MRKTDKDKCTNGSDTNRSHAQRTVAERALHVMLTHC